MTWLDIQSLLNSLLLLYQDTKIIIKENLIELVDLLLNWLVSVNWDTTLHFNCKCIEQLVTATWLAGRQLLSLYKLAWFSVIEALVEPSRLKQQFNDNRTHTRPAVSVIHNTLQSHKCTADTQREHSYSTNTPLAILSTGGTETRWGGTEMDNEEFLSSVGRRRRRRSKKRSGFEERRRDSDSGIKDSNRKWEAVSWPGHGNVLPVFCFS